MRTFRGGHESIGRESARILAFSKENTQSTPSFFPSNGALIFARKVEKIIERIHPSILDEIRGISQETGFPYLHTLANVSLCGSDAYSTTGCLAFGISDEKGPLLCLNYETPRGKDFVRFFRTYFRLEPEGEHSSIIGTDCFLYPTDGINDHGVVVLSLKVSGRIGYIGLSPFLINRIVLDLCDSAECALSLLAKTPHMLKWNYLIADEDRMFLAEVHPPSNVRIAKDVSVGKDDIIAAGNFFRDDPVPSELKRVMLLENYLREARTTPEIPKLYDDIVRIGLLSNRTLNVTFYRAWERSAWIYYCKSSHTSYTRDEHRGSYLERVSLIGGSSELVP